MPAVTVVIPAFNPGRFLRPAVDSVIAQSFSDWQAVIVDDGSTEDLSWVDSVDSRVRRIRQDNAGLSAARNRALAETDGEFVAFLDADDLWRPEKLARQIEALGPTRAALCSTAFDIVDSDGTRIAPGFEGYAESYLELLRGNGICVSTVLVTRAVLDKVGLFDGSLRQVQDWDLWLRIAAGHRVVKLDTVLAGYRHHGENMSNNYWNLRAEAVSMLARQEAVARAGGRTVEAEAARTGQRRIRQLAGIQAFDHFRASVATRDPGPAVRHLGSAIRYAPRLTANSLLGKAFNRSGR